MSLAFPFSIINIPYSRREFKKKIRACATGKNPGKNPGVRHTYILMVTFHGAGDSAKSSANFSGEHSAGLSRNPSARVRFKDWKILF